MDMLYVALPIRADGMTFIPWGMYTLVGQNVVTNNRGTLAGADNMHPVHADVSGDSAWTIYHLGLSADMNFGDFFVRADGIYGSLQSKERFTGTGSVAGATVTMDNDKATSRGFYLAAKTGMKLDFGTPALTAWYTSGNRANKVAEGRWGTMPTLQQDGDPAFTATTLGAWGHFSNTPGQFLTSTGIGTTGVALAIENLSFIDKVFHTPLIAYWKGTNDEGFRGSLNRSRGNGALISKKDSVIEFNFDTRYAFARNMNLLLNMGYLRANWNEKGPHGTATEWTKNGYRLATGFTASF
jgi:hypothetical protein